MPKWTRLQIENPCRLIDLFIYIWYNIYIKNIIYKLYLLEKETIDKKLNELKGSVMDVNFGSQIRNYVMCPYTLVKDVRTGYEVSDVDRVLDGDIEGFLESYLKS